MLTALALEAWRLRSCHQNRPMAMISTTRMKLTNLRTLRDNRTGSSRRPRLCTVLPLASVPV